MFRIVMLRALLAAALAITIPASTTAQDEATPDGTEWYLVAYDAGGPDLTAVPWDVFATLTLDDGQAVGSTGCNGFAATYAIDGEQLTFSPRFQTQRACPGAKMEVEASYMAALPQTARWDAGPSRTRDRELILFDADDEPLLRFSPYDTVLLVRQVQELTAELEMLRTELEALRAGLPVSSTPAPSLHPEGGPLLAWGPLAVIEDDAAGGLDAAGGTGRVVIGDDCVFLRSPNGPRTTLIWRSGQTEWDAARRQIVFRDPDLGRISLAHGDRISLGGAALGEGPYTAPVWLARPDETCPVSAWVVNQIIFTDE
jgi:heat shock protein HslJ